MKTRNEHYRGQVISYQREIMFKGTETVTAKIVAIYGRTLLLDNGDEIITY
ncbi:hypothetical protein GCM10027275_50270 [Rhabdobacter roseus]|uniref:Uncharacterized protein n=1 Tax=Rhabdobacter roseus TaxID=1655419 RepID=A0A840U5K1_9BACT|nr:hypothetical protein [Rhabdobacter roseus]MBB5287099.1 hypothetical protein [Rhabdobacter roseus]